MTREELTKLAERVEALTEKCWDTDDLIYAALGFDNEGYRGSPDYTADLDAAMSLVPEGWGGAIHFSENRLHSTVKLGRSYPTNVQAFGEAATPALALTAAALRALAEQQP